jgi:membrane-associated phospholipid phosphatase
VTEVGDVFQWLLPALAFGSTFVAGSPEDKWWEKEGAWQFTKSAGSTIVTTQVLKSVTGKWRSRSYTGAEPPSDISFPSGHTSAAFAGAAFINTRYGPWWGVPAYAATVFRSTRTIWMMSPLAPVLRSCTIFCG